MLDKYYPRNKVLLGILPMEMRYAGPREAVHHALIRKNYGCTHFIIGRDHAGVKDFYPPYAAQEIFKQFTPEEIGIKILSYPEVVYDEKKKVHCFVGDCKDEEAIKFSGTKMRSYIEEKQQPPEYILRPEIYNLLVKSSNSMVDEVYKNSAKHQKGFVLWFTGLSQSGKSTIADLVYEKLKNDGYKVERLDGDIVRETLTKDLGFSKEDRDENIRRVGFVAKLLSRNGIGVVASFISPFKKERAELRLKIENFIEVYVNTPIEECEKRDKKGLYAKARKGEIPEFTGVSSPYDVPESPDIVLDNVMCTARENADTVVEFLMRGKFV